MADKTRVLILGGGFGGLYAALQFEKRRDPRFEVTVVNRENFFLFTPMLHEIAASDLDLTNIVNPVRKMIRRVNFFCGDVDKIDIDKKQVVVSHGFDRHSHTLEYDHLVLALGSVTNFFNLPGVADRALTMKSLGDAIQLRNRLIAHLEEADTECARAERPPLLTFIAGLNGKAKKPFSFKTLGALAVIGRRTGVARILGINFSGFFAWFLWRGIYWSKLPRTEKKVRVAIDWALDVFFSKDFVQYLDQRALAHTQTETGAAPWNRDQISDTTKRNNAITG